MIYLGLGSNQGDRKQNLEMAIEQLESKGFSITAISPVVETPAMLPDNAKPGWNRPYLNCVMCGLADWSPKQGLDIAKGIEQKLGRLPAERWSPRPIDIDLLIWNNEIVEKKNLTVPHDGISQRNFVITPLLHLQHDLIIPTLSQSVFALSQSVKPVPLWMGILNITPDSFSDGGVWMDSDALICQIERFIENNVQIIDLGAESTRPNAQPVLAEEEWKRLEPVISLTKERCESSVLRPIISVDSRHWKTLEKALNYGVDMINDVTGLSDPNILALAKEHGCKVVAMHSVTIPVNPAEKLPVTESATIQLKRWIEGKIEYWLSMGINLNQVIIDPGIGFGTRPLQSQELLSNCRALRELGLPLLIGHSRKSFMNRFSSDILSDRDIETLGVSMSIWDQGVDIIRVHDPVMHIRAYRAWSHIEQYRNG